MKSKFNKALLNNISPGRLIYTHIIRRKRVIISVCNKGLILTGFQCIVAIVIAQQPYSIIHYDETVLPQTSIGNIEQDTNGYLWMSTQFGIVRFDGEKFRVFTTENLKGLTSNRIRICAKGPDQSIYFLDENSVIVKVKSPNQFETVPLSEALQESKPLYTSESNNDFTFLPIDKKAGYKQLEHSLLIDTTREFLKSYAISQKEGYAFYVDLQQKTRLLYYDGQHYISRLLSNSFMSQHTFKLNNHVFSQLSPTKTFLFQKAGQMTLMPVKGLPSRFKQAFSEDTHVLFSNESGTFFYTSGELYQYELNDGAIIATLVFKDLPCTGVANIMKERTTGDFLISTKSTGFYRIKKKQFSVINLTAGSKIKPGANNGFNSNMVYALALWDPQHIFCTSYITPVTGGGISQNFDPANKARFNHFFVYAKNKDEVWLNMNNGLQSLIKSFNRKSRTYTSILNVVDPRKVVEFSDGATVIVSARSIAALQNNKVTELYRSDTAEFTTAEKLTEDCVVIGTSKGICYFYPSKKKLEAVLYKETLKVRYILKDKTGRIWFTTYGQGLFYVSGNSIIPIPLDNAGYLSIGHNISEDNSGHFWVSTNHGLFKLGYPSLLSIIEGKSSKLYYTYFDKTDGFNTNEFNGGCFPSAAYQPETGLMFFPSMDGIVKFHPDSIQSVNSNGLIFFDEIVLNDTGKIQNVKDKLVFPKQTSTIRLNFSSPYYGHVENVKFSYSLSNASNHWIELQGNRNIVLNNLPGGSYKLVIKKEDATHAPILTSLNFQIQKKFSETFLFKLLLLAAIVALVYLYFRTRLHYLSNERKRLEKEVMSRTADQLNLIGQLENNIARLTQLQLELQQMIEHKENVVAVLIHDIKSPLHFLNTVAAHLDKGIALNPPEKNKKITSEISVSLNRLYMFTQDFAIWLDASRPGYIQKREILDLHRIIVDALTIYKEIIEKKGIIIRQKITARTVFGDEPMIKSVIRNLIDNAVKNTLAGTIIIETYCSADEQTGEIIIADEGKGMTGKDIAAINNYFQQHEDVQAFSTSGFGHRIIKDFLLKLGGDVNYQHNRPSGIIVTLNLPVRNFSEPHELNQKLQEVRINRI